MQISSAFDAGNINVIEIADRKARLSINRDHNSEFAQWFYFRLSGTPGETCTLDIENLNESAYPGGWPGYDACASYDRGEDWFRLPTSYDEKAGVLRIEAKLERPVLWIAYFAPYSMERHHDLIAKTAACPFVKHDVLGHTLDGQPMDRFTFGEPGEGKPVCWINARQHPGESMGQWWMEGALEMLTDPADPVATALRKNAVIHVMPNMNPDGSKRGHLRTNAAGVNLNREWDNPSEDSSPEVFHVRNAMDETGVDYCIDVHGDEAIANVFIAGFEGIPSLTERQTKAYDHFIADLTARCPDFQTEEGYPEAEPGGWRESVCTDQVAERYGAVAMTLEMPFKDAKVNPEPGRGWSPARSKHLARHCLRSLYATLPLLKA